MKNGALSVNLFPDSGHHFYFVPLAIAEGQGTDAAKEYVKENDLPELNTESLGALAILCSSAPEWFSATRNDGRSLAWIRGKFGSKRDNSFSNQGLLILGLWCAIETNTGVRRDGYVFDVDNRPAQNDLGWETWKKNPDESSPYIAVHTSEIDFSKTSKLDLDKVFGLSSKLGSSVGLCGLEINWQSDESAPVPVNLTIDFGNTRTIAIGLEIADRIASSNLQEIFRPIYFQRGYDDAAVSKAHTAATDELIPYSWIILREPTFSGAEFAPPNFVWPDYIEKPKIKSLINSILVSHKNSQRSNKRLERIVNRVPYMFTELSPVVMGLEATDLLAGTDIGGGHLSFLSSPKRYAWDNDPVGEGGLSVWYMHPRTGVGKMRQLQGEIFRFLPRSLKKRIEITEDDSPHPLSPTEWPDESERPTSKPTLANFGRADTLIWSALAIIERASKQIQSEAWRSNYPVRRYLDTIVVTFPPGWTNEELLAYWRAWYLAKEIYNWSHDSKLKRITLDLRLDEAVASQLAIVFSEIRHRENSAKNWINEIGRLREAQHTVRVLTIDIGGGTLDTAVVEYVDEAPERSGVHLTVEVLYRDSSTNAGDKLLKELIEGVFLPTLGERFRNDPIRKVDFENFFSSSPMMREAENRLRRMVITRSVFMPMVYKWLEDLSNDRKGDPTTRAKWSPIGCGANLSQIEKLNLAFKSSGLAEDSLLQADEPFDIDYSKIDKLITEWFKPLADLHARYLKDYDCDLVIVTGKPSELPEVRALLQDRLPIGQDRIIFAKNYSAGDWFPGAVRGKIPDAKMVTVVGAALFTAITSNLIPNWRINQKVGKQVRNFWGIYENDRAVFKPGHILLDPNQDEVELELSTFCQIGRARFPENTPELVYILRWRDRDMAKARGTCTIKVRIRRVYEDFDHRPLMNEHLRLEQVSGQDDFGEPITLDDIDLQLRTLGLDELHWLDQGKFTITWD